MSTPIVPTLKGQCIAEFLGTALLIFFGTGCVAALKLGGADLGLWEISIIWGIGVSMAVYLAAGVSGAHLNPAVTIALWLFGTFERHRVPAYILAQVAGAFCSAALVYGLYMQPVFRFRTGPADGSRKRRESRARVDLLHLSARLVVVRSGVPCRSGHYGHSAGDDHGHHR